MTLIRVNELSAKRWKAGYIHANIVVSFMPLIVKRLKSLEVMGDMMGFVIKSEYSKCLICCFFCTFYTAKTTISFSNFFHWKYYESCWKKEQRWSDYLMYPLLSEKGHWTSMKYHTFKIDSLVFSVVFKICKNL